jgi:tRNA(Ile)-lysidine synthase
VLSLKDCPATKPGHDRRDETERPVSATTAAPKGIPAQEQKQDHSFSPDRIAGLFGDWESQRGILLAVSGGPDSVALMLLAARWMRGRNGPFVHVATVDHGLRSSSREEAEAVARWAAKLALPHDILVWDDEKPSSRIQERAREARYRLLCAHAAKIGASCIATAHHADDQAETILFRLLRGSGLTGLAGMAALSARAGLVHSRPLLACRKAELVAYCQAHAHPFFEDPSNQDPRFARTRIRDIASALAEHGLDCEALQKLGARAARAELALAAGAESARAALPATRTHETFSADVTGLAGAPEEIVLRILAREIKDLSNQRELRLERLESLARKLHRALRDGAALTATLGGTVLRLSRERQLTIGRERRRTRGNPTNAP